MPTKEELKNLLISSDDDHDVLFYLSFCFKVAEKITYKYVNQNINNFLWLDIYFNFIKGNHARNVAWIS